MNALALLGAAVALQVLLRSVAGAPADLWPQLQESEPSRHADHRDATSGVSLRPHQPENVTQVLYFSCCPPDLPCPEHARLPL